MGLVSRTSESINPFNAELNPICHLLALLGAYHIFHVSRLRVKGKVYSITYLEDPEGKCRYRTWALDGGGCSPPRAGRFTQGKRRVRLHLKCDGTRAETRFRLPAKRTGPFKSVGVWRGVSPVDYWQPRFAHQR
jgi:hypothetical protein